MMDTARFKYPPHWVPVQLLWDAMHAIDKSTGKISLSSKSNVCGRWRGLSFVMPYIEDLE
jgi:hypothetical protein